MGAKTRTAERTPATEARAAVLRLMEIEREQTEQRVEKAARLVEAERQSGDAVVEAALSGSGQDRYREITAEVAGLRTELDVIDRAIDAARIRRRAAIAAVRAADAAELRERAAALYAEAEEREQRTRDLLAPLEEWEDCKYAPAPAERTEVDWLVIRPTPKTQRIRNEAASLDARAQEVAAEDVMDSGQVQGASGQELVAAITAEPLRLGPPIAEVLAWAASAAERERRRRDRLRRFDVPTDEAEAPMLFTLVWVHEAVDTQRSTVENA